MTTEAQRQREWAVVVKKVEADKLREEQQAHHKSRIEFEQAKGELEKTIARLSAELSSRDQGLAAKTAEAASLSKQVRMSVCCAAATISAASSSHLDMTTKGVVSLLVLHCRMGCSTSKSVTCRSSWQ